MNLFKKLSTAVRGAATEVGEEIVDSQATRILDQELRDAEEELDKAKTSLATLMAKRKVHENDLSGLQKDRTKYFNAARTAKNQENMGLARECAEKVASLDEEVAETKSLVGEYTSQEAQLKKWVDQTQSSIDRLKRQADSVRATAQIHKARAAVASKYSGTNTGLGSAAESLERIKRKQAEQAAQFDAASEMANTNDLDAKLKKAGIGSNKKSADDILNSL